MTANNKESSRTGESLVLVDGSSYLFRAYHALPPLTNSAGKPTGVTFGVINMLRRMRREYPTTHFAVVFDTKGPTFRHAMYADYKANRPPMPEDLAEQIEPTHEVIRAMGIPLLAVPGVEADDVIGTLAHQASAAGMNTIISTADKDMAQLVDENTIVVNTMSNTTMDAAGVAEKFGVAPERIVDYLTLIGDTVDNVPGVPKVGPKTAVKWLTEHGDLDGIIAHADQIKGKVGENLRDVIDQLPLSRELVTIKCDLELDTTPRALHLNTPDTDRLHELFSTLEFKSWLIELEEQGAGAGTGGVTADSGLDTDHYETVTETQDLRQWIERLTAADLFALDLETDSLDYMQARIVGISFATDAGAAYVPVGHDYPGAPDQLPLETVLEALRPLLLEGDPRIVGQHFKYDMNVLRRYGMEVATQAHDTMLESYVFDSTASRHDMDSLADKYLGHKTVSFKEIAGSGKNQLTFNQIDLEQASHYAAEDADVTLRLHQHLWPQLNAQEGPARVYRQIEMPLVPILSRMECDGVLIDAAMLAAQGKEITSRLAELEQQAHAAAGQPFNLASPKQLQEILYEQLGLPVLRKTPKGQPSTAEEVLLELAEHYELPQLILDHRSLAKLKSTYIDKLPEMIDPDSGRVHTSYHQAVASTGRLSSSDPNLQNIPVRTAEGRRIRQAFIPPDGHRLVAADYSQVELRIMAHLSADAGLLGAFEQGEDIHRATAAEVFGTPLEQVDDEQRRRAKAINFGLIYGMSAFGLGRQLGIPRNEAQEYVDLYFARYPGVRQYMDDTRARAHDTGYVETVFGRRLYLPEINDRNAQRRQYAERTAINAPMQGTAADLIKLAMIRIGNWLQGTDNGVRMIMQVHDELVFEVPKDAVDEVAATISRLMESDNPLAVPLLVDVGAGNNWDEAH